jgi:hypothetical protein
MGLIDLVGGLLGGVPKAIGDYFTARATAKAQEQLRKLELEDAIHKRKVELVQAGLHADATWELEQIRNSGSKDEWVLFLLSIPLVGCFVPGLADRFTPEQAARVIAKLRRKVKSQRHELHMMKNAHKSWLEGVHASSELQYKRNNLLMSKYGTLLHAATRAFGEEALRKALDDYDTHRNNGST